MLKFPGRQQPEFSVTDAEHEAIYFWARLTPAGPWEVVRFEDGDFWRTGALEAAEVVELGGPVSDTRPVCGARMTRF